MNALDNLKCIRYPIAELKLDELTGLDETLAQQGDTVILGYVDQIGGYFQSIGEEIKACYETEYYGVERDTINNKEVIYLGIKNSYWGNISAKIVKRLAKLEASSIIYCAKLGCLTFIEDIYNSIFTPDKFITGCRNNLKPTFNLHNSLAEFSGNKKSTHLSVPTILEETYEQRDEATNHGVTSIDNEISAMVQ